MRKSSEETEEYNRTVENLVLVLLQLLDAKQVSENTKHTLLRETFQMIFKYDVTKDES